MPGVQRADWVEDARTTSRHSAGSEESYPASRSLGEQELAFGRFLFLALPQWSLHAVCSSNLTDTA